jgi:hypothetical protein
LAIWVGVNLLFLILQFLKLEILLLICTSFGGAYNMGTTSFVPHLATFVHHLSRLNAV